METEASFHGFAAKLSAGSLARVGFGQSDITAGKQRAGAWGGVLVSGSPAVGVWWAVAVFLHPRLQLLLEHSSLASRNFSTFVPSDLQLVIASLLLVQCASPVKTLYSYPLTVTHMCPARTVLQLKCTEKQIQNSLEYQNGHPIDELYVIINVFRALGFINYFPYLNLT